MFNDDALSFVVDRAGMKTDETWFGAAMVWVSTASLTCRASRCIFATRRGRVSRRGSGSEREVAIDEIQMP